MKKKLLALLCAGFMVFALGLMGCSNNEPKEEPTEPAPTEKNDAPSDEIKLINDGKLTVAASLDFPPFENLEGDQAVGFAVELMDLLAEEMGLEAEYLPSVKFDTIVTVIATGDKADVGVSSITINPERLAEVDFTDSYYDSNQAVVVMEDSDFKNLSDLAGKKIGAQSGTTGEANAREKIENAEVISFDEVTAIYTAIQAGQIDAIAVDLPVAQEYQQAYPDTKIIDEIPTGEQYGIAVSKENPALTKALNEALSTIKSNGKYDDLYNKWFDE